MSFHEVRFPPALSFGSVGGPERRTEIVALASGHEERSTPWAHSRRRYDAGVGMRSRVDLEALIAFFEARSGRLHGFRWKDWSDYASGVPAVAATDQTLGIGDGARTAFQLVKTYVSGGQSYVRPIAKPVAGTVRVALDGVELGPGWAVDPANGVVTFDLAPGAAVAVTAGFEFDVPVRFDTDRLEISVAGVEAGEVPSVPVVELRV